MLINILKVWKLNIYIAIASENLQAVSKMWTFFNKYKSSLKRLSQNIAIKNEKSLYKIKIYRSLLSEHWFYIKIFVEFSKQKYVTVN